MINFAHACQYKRSERYSRNHEFLQVLSTKQFRRLQLLRYWNHIKPWGPRQETERIAIWLDQHQQIEYSSRTQGVRCKDWKHFRNLRFGCWQQGYLQHIDSWFSLAHQHANNKNTKRISHILHVRTKSHQQHPQLQIISKRWYQIRQRNRLWAIHGVSKYHYRKNRRISNSKQNTLIGEQSSWTNQRC